MSDESKKLANAIIVLSRTLNATQRYFAQPCAATRDEAERRVKRWNETAPEVEELANR